MTPSKVVPLHQFPLQLFKSIQLSQAEHLFLTYTIHNVIFAKKMYIKGGMANVTCICLVIMCRKQIKQRLVDSNEEHALLIDSPIGCASRS